jgi:WD40 repeat protein
MGIFQKDSGNKSKFKDINNLGINYKFNKNPNFKYKFSISKDIGFCGYNDIFEVFISLKDNKEYLVSRENKILVIYLLIDHKKIKSLEGHYGPIYMIRYFINHKNNNEYLISGDSRGFVIIWNIINNYNKKYVINTNYDSYVYGLLFFPSNINNNYIITGCIDNNQISKIYSFENKELIKNIEYTNNREIYNLLSWHNRNNNQYYIIQLSNKSIIISNLLLDTPNSYLINEPESNHYSGYIYNKDDIDYLCCSSINGNVTIWDLYTLKIFKVINISKNGRLYNIIQWNDRYCIVGSINSVIIIDLVIYRVISIIKDKDKNDIICVKKIKHPIYGEAFLTLAKENMIKLWITLN